MVCAVWHAMHMHLVSDLVRCLPLCALPPVPQDPIFKGNKVPNPEMGYPGGIFDPLGFSKGNLKELQTKEIKNGRIAMIAFMAFVIQVRGSSMGQHMRRDSAWMCGGWVLHEAAAAHSGSLSLLTRWQGVYKCVCHWHTPGGTLNSLP